MSNNSVAALGGGIVGAGVGFIVGGPAGASLGFSIGSAVGSALVPLQVPDQVGPRLDDLTVTSSAFGQPIPLLWGSNRVSGNLIFSSGKKETKREEEVGGKGGPPEQTVVSYTYSIDACYSLGVLPPSATSLEVRKVWINSQLVYDVSDTTNAISLIKSTKLAAAVTVYDGSETQLPSSLQESYKGAGNVPAYRGMGLIEFEDLQLGEFGNGSVNVSCEVVVSGTPAGIPSLVNDWAGPRAGLGVPNNHCLFYDNGTVWNATYACKAAGTSGYECNGFYYILSQYDLLGNKLSEIRTLYDVGNVSFIRFGTNDPFMCMYLRQSAGPVYRFARPLSPGINGPDVDVAHPFNTSNTEAWGAGQISYRWIKVGDYYYVSGGNYNPPASSSPAHISRYPIITDPLSVYYGYPQTNPDISIDIGSFYYAAPDMPTRYGETGTYFSYDIKTNRIYRIGSGPSGGNWTLSSWDLNLNPIARWDLSSIPGTVPDLEYEVNFISGTTLIRPHDNTATKALYHYEFDPDTSQSEFVLINTVSTAEAVGNTPIFALTENLALAKNVIISTDPLVSQQNVTLATIFGDILSLTGAEASDYDVSTLTDTVLGYNAGKLVSARRSIEPLMRAFFIDAAEVDNKIVFTKRGGSAIKTIPDSDLMSVNQSTIRINRGSELELPKRVTFSYINQAADYQVNEQHADRLVTVGSVGISNISIPAVIDDDEGAQIADAMLYSTWIERELVEFSGSTKLMELTPADVVTLGDAGLRVRITEVDTKLISTIKFKGVIDFASSYVSTKSGGAATASSTISGIPGPTITNLLDIPILRDVDAGIIKYLSTSGTLDGWGGALLYRSTDSGINYTERASSVVNGTYGFSTDVLADGDTSTWDSVNTVNIGLAAGTLTTASELSTLNGANAAAFGKHGRWEIIQFQTATLEGDGTYTLSDLLRGRRGTEHNTANHVIGDSFVLLNETSLTRLNYAAADIGSSYLYKGVSIGNSLQETTALPFSAEGVSITPFSPAYIQGTRDVSNNLTVTFKRRDYMGYTAKYTIPMSEDTESYEIEFWDTGDTAQYGTFKTATSETYSYTAAAQTTDTATPGQSFLVKIYQISATIGRGYEGSEII